MRKYFKRLFVVLDNDLNNFSYNFSCPSNWEMGTIRVFVNIMLYFITLYFNLLSLIYCNLKKSFSSCKMGYISAVLYISELSLMTI